MTSIDPALLQTYRDAETELGLARSAGATHPELIPLLIKAREAWEACFLPALRERTALRQARRNKANGALHRVADNLSDEEKAAITEVYGVPF